MSAEKLPRTTPPGSDRAGADLRRAELSFAGLSRGGDRLLLANEDGVTFSLDIDARLRSALRGEDVAGETAGPVAAQEAPMDSALRPRDIQARIRAGETPEALASAAQTPLEKIMVYAGPVMAERVHVAERAQKASVRRRAGDSGGSRTLGDAVSTHLRGHNVDPGVVSWDAWRREDGRWVVTAAFTTSARSGTAALTFDLPGNFVTLDDEDATWLVGDLIELPDRSEPADGSPIPVEDHALEAEAADDLDRARRRRQAGVPLHDPHQDELPLGDDAIGLVSDPEPVEAEPAPEPVVEHEAPPVAPPTPPARPARKKGRASVPSWDDIMFGGGPTDR